jgi:UDP-3-O-[3-hydroxymyristoyl] glucosamine N-acyltransferase
VTVQNGAVLGGDGFGFARDAQGRYHKIPQVGVVVVEDDVEIGALAAIDRAALGETRVGRGTKIDNLVQVGHSVTIGADTVLAGQVGIAGSTRIGERVTLAGQVGVAGHLTVGDGVIATAQTGIPSSVPADTVVSGYPAVENKLWLRATAIFAKLPDLLKRVRALERRLGAKGGDET